jgi:hypothetical protein
VDVVLQRIEALPGEHRYAVSFRRPDGSEQTAIVRATGTDVSVPEASLPDGWTRGTEPFRAAAEAVLAVERARTIVTRVTSVRDVDGGWDVALGNVVLTADDQPECIAHGIMQVVANGVFECAECGARAAYGGIDGG